MFVLLEQILPRLAHLNSAFQLVQLLLPVLMSLSLMILTWRGTTLSLLIWERETIQDWVEEEEDLVFRQKLLSLFKTLKVYDYEYENVAIGTYCIKY